MILLTVKEGHIPNTTDTLTLFVHNKANTRYPLRDSVNALSAYYIVQ